MSEQQESIYDTIRSDWQRRQQVEREQAERERNLINSFYGSEPGDELNQRFGITDGPGRPGRSKQ